ncbi:hypothetical protein EXN66_Car003304 [Channa argus]|uniref:Uncharacterized protein n=1 Tax=Channa argus TaxID=215402 RepID=A0A6G1PBL8_CHAAH|nr:hypothetical protein EXN66_Car003304 [Channa argus]
MRLLLAITLILLFLWLHKAQMSGDNLHGYPCEAVSMSKAAVSLLLSPLSLYSWLSATLLRLILSSPALVLSSFYHSLLLLLAWPWCIAIVCISALLTCLHVAVYLFHLALGVGVFAILILTRHKMADSDSASVKGIYQQKKLEHRQTKTDDNWLAVHQG